MTDKSNVDDLAQTGADGNQPSVSPGEGKSIDDAPSLQEFLALKKRLELNESELKGLQSRQDKEKNEVQRFMDEIKARMAKGLSLEEAEQAVTADRKAQEKDDLLFKIAQKVGVLDSSPQTAPAGNGTQAANDAARIIANYALDANDPDVIAEVLSKPTAEMEAYARALLIRRANPKAVSAGAAPVLGGAPPRPAGIEQLTDQYVKDMLAAPRGRAGDAQRNAIKAKANAAGVPVDKIGFR